MASHFGDAWLQLTAAISVPTAPQLHKAVTDCSLAVSKWHRKRQITGRHLRRRIMAGAAATPASATRGDKNAAGQPDTPMEVLTDLLAKAMQCQDTEQANALVKQAHGIASGLDPYLDSISTPPSQVRRPSDDLLCVCV